MTFGMDAPPSQVIPTLDQQSNSQWTEGELTAEAVLYVHIADHPLNISRRQNA